MSGHSPTPWALISDPLHYDSRTDIAAPNGDPIAQTCGEWAWMEPNAAFIVRAANSHEALVAAARKVMDGLLARIDNATADGTLVPVFDGIAELHDALAKAGAS